MYRWIEWLHIITHLSKRDFPGGPVVETLPSNGQGADLIPGQRAKIPQALQPKNQSIKQKQCCNKFSKDFKNGPHQKKKKKALGKEPELRNHMVLE